MCSNFLKIMEQVFYDKLHHILTNKVTKHDTGCHITHILPYKGSRGYPRIHFTYLRKRFQVKIHTYVFRMTNDIPPYIRDENLECSHLCHNKQCIFIDHLVMEPHKINIKRQECNRKKLCLGHEGYPKCISLCVKVKNIYIYT